MKAAAGHYVVTTSIRGVSRTQIWHAHSPLTLGHPLHWVIERTENGVRARNISGTMSVPRKEGLRELDNQALEKGAELELPFFEEKEKRPPCVLKIHRMTSVRPIFTSREGDVIQAFACAGNWILSSRAVEQEYLGIAQKRTVFSLKRTGRRKSDNYELTMFDDGLQLRLTGTQKIGKSNTPVSISPEELLQCQIILGTQTWHFGLVQAPSAQDLTRSEIEIPDPETAWFKHSLRYAGIAFGLFIALCFIWPKPPAETELVPPQFTKIVMGPQKPAGQEDAGGSEKKGTTKIQDAAVVQAFRAKALRNSINGLLKGGMTRLLAQSDIVVGTRNSANARKLFDSKSSALQATGAEIGLMNAKNVQVGSIGGAGGAGGGTGVGYGKGQHAGIQGQGNSLVSLDLGNTSVEEGLTKEQVGEVIHKHLSEIRYCYEAAMLRASGIEGRLIVNFTIGGNGVVKSSEVKSSTLPDPALDDCILRRLNTWKFPEPKGRIEVGVSYPFIFKTLGGG
ncbi:MAG: hypothetical protein A2428_11755 [Bdellovibrionales bacterium RIFOXYC1_FULL_54_43]|nr:MAG: hypothetical protein A2428_11755 [Bdellovibrionales bacterium RIFOXYC1_FULL_54_43]OFZ81732.1 MAG: hypothetical protein A2603_09675 [Bdellovibrionales bacterium RIFOXYD1_FULL_55_31]